MSSAQLLRRVTSMGMMSLRGVGLNYRLMVGTGTLPVFFLKKNGQNREKSFFLGVAPPYTPPWKVSGKIASTDLIIVNLSGKKYGRVVSGDNPRRSATA